MKNDLISAKARNDHAFQVEMTVSVVAIILMMVGRGSATAPETSWVNTSGSTDPIRVNIREVGLEPAIGVKQIASAPCNELQNRPFIHQQDDV